MTQLLGFYAEVHIDSICMCRLIMEAKMLNTLRIRDDKLPSEDRRGKGK
jgi:hypothetical protein